MLDGVKLKMATGFNARWIFNNGIGPGAIIEVARAGLVIPTILKVRLLYSPGFRFHKHRSLYASPVDFSANICTWSP
jgi:NAD-dependent DNA ligase